MATSLRNLTIATQRATLAPVATLPSSCVTSLPVPRAKGLTSRRSNSTIACRPLSRSWQKPRIPTVQSVSRNPHASRSLASASDSTSKFTFGISSSFSAKDRRFNPAKNVFNFNPYNHILARRKDKSTRPDSGQDAFFISRVGESSDVAFGIADGVGGWVDSGVDPADFSHGFCDYMAHAAYTHKPDVGKPNLGARSLMQRGYEDICDDGSVRAGGSTACVGIVRGIGKLEVANLGDSGFVQLRLNAVHSYSEPQTHAFNTPYQLSIIPKQMQARQAAFGGQQLCDMPKDANASQHALRHGDVLVFASDGVWDNLSRHDVLKIVSKIMVSAKAWVHTEKGIDVGPHISSFITTDDGSSGDEEIPPLQSFLAVGIAHEAKMASVNTKLDGPFAREVQREYPNENWRGGKVDDICVVVVVVCEEGK
ncbi:hypothetical protein HYALB_00006146 [Hymenoscyphus albidus]|uniref:Protein phosphatase n=1 Tax=Hymenoscyphus albidus TaxID=595503 RepID=A0A9N9LLK1_9HELO|nr:hypothetical protein HYALB_00006146 [Hymenoscyphus albidus]